MSQTYASVTLDSSTNPSSAEFNPWASTSHAAYAATERIAGAITYTSIDGKFTLNEDGQAWRFSGMVFIENTSGTFPATVTYKLKINGSVEWSAEVGVHAAADPYPYPWKLTVGPLNAGDFIELVVEETGTGDQVRVVDGSTFNVARWA